MLTVKNLTTSLEKCLKNCGKKYTFLCWPMLRKQLLLITVDASTKCIRIFYTKTISEWCIKKLRSLFTTFGTTHFNFRQWVTLHPILSRTFTHCKYFRHCRKVMFHSIYLQWPSRKICPPVKTLLTVTKIELFVRKKVQMSSYNSY